MNKLYTLFFFLFFLRCSTMPIFHEKTIDEHLNERIKEPFDTTKIIPIYFATNRSTANGIPSCSNDYYTVDLSPKIIQGVCEVNVPFKHNIGDLSADPANDPDQYFRFMAHKPVAERDFLNSVTANPFPEVILFVHGFNVSFEEAVYRSAQIKYDLKFAGEVVLFTWPAGAKSGGILEALSLSSTYKNNQKNAQGTVSILKDFVKNLHSSGKRLHIIVHSMGHQIVLPALAELSSEGNKEMVSELVLNAPDYPSSTFYGISNNIQKVAKRVTVYCSPGDKALVASRRVNENKRLGSCEKIAGIDTVNVNEIDDSTLSLNHGYYSSRPILTDLYQVLLGVKAEKRLFIRKSVNATEDYILRR
jgi:esterase/lipase superfamily enzyme